MNISDRVANIQPSLTRKLFNMAKNYNDVIDLTLGDPDLPPPKEISTAAYKAMCDNKIHYSANAGLYEARETVAGKIQRVWGLKCDPNKNVIITVGGMEALYLSLLSLVNPGDEVILFAPYYVNYIQMIELCGGIPVVLDAYNLKEGFSIDKKVLESAVTERTVAIIINSPNNPTGDIIDLQMLRTVAETAEENDLTVISDEVYRTLIYDDVVHRSILEIPDICKRTVLIDSLSKEYSMTGWRIGYAYADEKLIKNMVKLQENVAACASLPSQYALIEAYTKDIPNRYITDEFQNRRDYLVGEINKIEKLVPIKPKGTFYLFVNIENTGMKSERFAYELLEKAHIAVVPGIAYGDSYDDYIRIAFTKDIQTLETAVKRLKKFFIEQKW